MTEKHRIVEIGLNVISLTNVDDKNHSFEGNILMVRFFTRAYFLVFRAPAMFPWRASPESPSTNHSVTRAVDMIRFVFCVVSVMFRSRAICKLPSTNDIVTRTVDDNSHLTLLHMFVSCIFGYFI